MRLEGRVPCTASLCARSSAPTVPTLTPPTPFALALPPRGPEKVATLVDRAVFIFFADSDLDSLVSGSVQQAVHRSNHHDEDFCLLPSGLPRCWRRSALDGQRPDLQPHGEPYPRIRGGQRHRQRRCVCPLLHRVAGFCARCTEQTTDVMCGRRRMRHIVGERGGGERDWQGNERGYG